MTTSAAASRPTVTPPIPPVIARQRKAQLLLNSATTGGGAELAAVAGTAAADAAASLPSGSTYRVLVRAGNSPLAPESGFDVIVEIEPPDSGDLVDLSPFVQRFGTALVGEIDATRSGAAAGTEYTLVAGDGDLRIVYYLHPKEGWTDEQFWEYWLDPHSAYGPVLSDAPYRQFHNTDRALAAAFAAEVGGTYVDGGGAVHRFYADLADMARSSQNSDPDLVAEGSADTASFVDLERDTGGLLRVVVTRVTT